ncbi:Add1 [Symbiodinium natans]|uniref:Add1 protein n=1 Tax=Symbiodinium natans TaxID=878477 RepID=A0A812UXS0_9DINO|nr:Add1 [Symbiodinium natans]
MRRLEHLSQHLLPRPVAAPLDLPAEAAGLARRDRTRRDTTPRQKTQFSPVEWEARCKLAVAYRLAAHYGWDQLVFNHITLKVPESDLLSDGPHFLINPFGLRFDEVTASSLLKVDLDGNVVDKGTNQGPLFKQGFVVHSAVHAARPDITCVWHCHHADTVAVVTSTAGFLPLTQEAISQWGLFSYHPFEGSAVDLDERQRMANNLGPKNKVLLLENHGPLTAGGSVEEAFFRMYMVTLSCTWQVKAMAAVGGDLSKLRVPSGEYLASLKQRDERIAAKSATSKDDVDRKNESYNEVEAMWHAARRLMESFHGPASIYC